MARMPAAAVCLALAVAPLPLAAQGLTQAESDAIEDTVGRLFAEITEATSALDLERLLALHENSDDLTYVAAGRVTRSRAAFAGLLEEQLGGLSAADVRLLDPFVDVLGRDVALATSTYEFTATFPSGSRFTTTGTYMAVFVRKEDGWKIRYSSHTFPQREP
jgi:ketosteroid isomerase-like protein